MSDKNANIKDVDKYLLPMSVRTSQPEGSGPCSSSARPTDAGLATDISRRQGGKCDYELNDKDDNECSEHGLMSAPEPQLCNARGDDGNSRQ